MILPRVKSIVYSQKSFTKSLVFENISDVSSKALYFIKLFRPDLCIQTGKDATVSLTEKDSLSSGAYEICVDTEEISIFYGDAEGVRNAVATLSQLITDDGIECCEIKDAPDNEFRSCMLDLARGYVELPVLREHLIRMALLKFNHIHFHLMDRQTYVLESEFLPNPSNYRQYTKKEMKELVEFCKGL